MRRSLVLISLLFCAACSGPRDFKIPADKAAWKADTEFKAAIDELEDEEKELLRTWMMRHAVAEAFGGTMPEATIGEAIEQQRAFASEKSAEHAETERQAAEHDAAARGLASTIEMTPVSYGLNVGKPEYTHDDWFELKVTFRNTADKDVSAVKGAVVFKDAFGEEIKRVNLEMQDTIAANSEIEWSGELDLNQFSAVDQKLVSTPVDKMTLEWLPDTILLVDGTKIEAHL
jgi:hypothetical protein